MGITVSKHVHVSSNLWSGPDQGDNELRIREVVIIVYSDRTHLWGRGGGAMQDTTYLMSLIDTIYWPKVKRHRKVIIFFLVSTPHAIGAFPTRHHLLTWGGGRAGGLIKRPQVFFVKRGWVLSECTELWTISLMVTIWCKVTVYCLT